MRNITITLVIGLGLLASACGDSAAKDASGASANEGVASLAEESPVTSTSEDAPEAPAEPEEAFRLFEQCMKDEGIEFNTVGGSSGGLIVGAEPLDEQPDPQAGGLAHGDFDPETFSAAEELCSQHLANIDTAFDMSPEQQVAMDEAQREFKACMEAEGVKIPDFESSGGGIIIGGPVEDDDPQAGEQSFGSPDFDIENFEQAADICSAAFEDMDTIFETSKP